MAIGSPEPINILDFIPQTLHRALREGTITTNLSPFLQDALDALKRKGGSTLFLPAGIYRLSRTVDLVDVSGAARAKALF